MCVNNPARTRIPNESYSPVRRLRTVDGRTFIVIREFERRTETRARITREWGTRLEIIVLDGEEIKTKRKNNEKLTDRKLCTNGGAEKQAKQISFLLIPFLRPHTHTRASSQRTRNDQRTARGQRQIRIIAVCTGTRSFIAGSETFLFFKLWLFLHTLVINLPVHKRVVENARNRSVSARRDCATGTTIRLNGARAVRNNWKYIVCGGTSRLCAAK